MKRPGILGGLQGFCGRRSQCGSAPCLNRFSAPVLVVIRDADPDWKWPLVEAQRVASNFTDVQTVVVSGAGHGTDPGAARDREPAHFMT